MKLLVVAPYFYPKVGGMENYAWNICKGLKKKYGWEIVAVASNHEANEYKEEIIEGIKIYRLQSWFKLSNTPINLGWFFDIAKIINTEKPDVINGHTPVPFISDIAAMVSTYFRIPFFLTYQNDLIKNNYQDIIFNIYYKTVGAITFSISKIIIASSQYYADKSKYLRNYLSKVKVIAPGIYLNSNIHSKSTNSNKILFVGQLDKTHIHKGLFYLIEALKEVVNVIPSAQLVIVGKGDYIEEYKKVIAKSKLTDHVVFLGFINDLELSEIYESVDVVTLPSISDSEGFGMVLIEAGAHKKPVIGSNIGGIPSIVKDNYNGYLVSPKNSEQLAEKTITILKNKVLAKKFGENGYTEVYKKYQWHTQVDKLQTIIKSST